MGKAAHWLFSRSPSPFASAYSIDRRCVSVSGSFIPAASAASIMSRTFMRDDDSAECRVAAAKSQTGNVASRMRFTPAKLREADRLGN